MALWGMAEKFKINRAPALMEIGHAAIKIDFQNAELERLSVFANARTFEFHGWLGGADGVVRRRGHAREVGAARGLCCAQRHKTAACLRMGCHGEDPGPPNNQRLAPLAGRQVRSPFFFPFTCPTYDHFHPF